MPKKQSTFLGDSGSKLNEMKTDGLPLNICRKGYRLFYLRLFVLQFCHMLHCRLEHHSFGADIVKGNL